MCSPKKLGGPGGSADLVAATWLVCRLEDAPNYLPAQLGRSLRWDWCQETLLSLGVDVALELGQANDLAKLLEASGQGISARAVEELTSTASIKAWLEARN